MCLHLAEYIIERKNISDPEATLGKIFMGSILEWLIALSIKLIINTNL